MHDQMILFYTENNMGTKRFFQNVGMIGTINNKKMIRHMVLLIKY
jgi:hypothetical protein